MTEEKNESAPHLPKDAEIRQETDEAFITQIQPMMGEMEAFRQQILKDNKKRRRIGLYIFVGVVLITLLTCLTLNWGCIFIGIALTHFIYWCVTSFDGAYGKHYKKKIMPAIANALGFACYRYGGAVDIEEMRPSGIIPSHDLYLYDDYFEGNYKGSRIRFCHADFRCKDTQYNTQSYSTVFDGLVILVDLARAKFSSKTIIFHRQSPHAEQQMEKLFGMEKVDLNATALAREFTVYTTDQVEARYLIDPVIMERINALTTAEGSAYTHVSYYDNKALLMVDSLSYKIFNAPPSSQEAGNVEGFLKIKHDVEAVLGFIDDVDRFLNHRHTAPIS